MTDIPNNANVPCYPAPNEIISDVLTRPSHVERGKGAALSFFWSPGIYLAEIIYVPRRGLRFVVRHQNSPLTVEEAAAGHPPLAWVEDYTRSGSMRLPSAIAGYDTLDELSGRLRDFVHKYFDCDPLFESVATLYALHTWVYERFHAVPYLRFLGPAGSGKTRATEVIGALCYHPLVIAGSVTPAPMFRMIEASGGTVLIDEADYRDSDVGADIVKVLNCGYQKGLPVTRMEATVKGEFVPRQYVVFGPKIINGRQRFNDEATETRCLSYTPMTTNRDDIPVQLPEQFDQEARDLQNQLLHWRFRTLESIAPNAEHVSGISRRMNQIILPLLTVADMMGDARRALYRADLLQFAKQADSQSLAIRAESHQAAIVRALLRCVSYTEPPTCKEIAGLAAMDDDETIAAEMKWITAKRVSHIVRELGFHTRHTREGSVVLLDTSRLQSLAVRFGVVIPATAEPPSEP
jgi:hypothetical protein